MYEDTWSYVFRKHNYSWDELDHNGFLVNFADLKKLIHNQFDHHLLNDLEPFKGKIHLQKLSHKQFILW